MGWFLHNFNLYILQKIKNENQGSQKKMFLFVFFFSSICAPMTCSYFWCSASHLQYDSQSRNTFSKLKHTRYLWVNSRYFTVQKCYKVFFSSQKKNNNNNCIPLVSLFTLIGHVLLQYVTYQSNGVTTGVNKQVPKVTSAPLDILYCNQGQKFWKYKLVLTKFHIKYF